MINYISLRSGSEEQRWYLSGGVYQRYSHGSLVDEHPFDTTDTAWRVVVQAVDAMDSSDLLTKLRTALNADKTYLDKVNAGTATNADHSVQVAALTRQMIAVLFRTILETG
jgi:hypothetical protein